jgi:hypothetical protein
MRMVECTGTVNHKRAVQTHDRISILPRSTSHKQS